MLTFSTPPTEANLLPGLVNVLNVLPDNTAKEISPKDVRDSVYTLWYNNILKPTSVSGSSVKYIGMDQYELRDSTSGDLMYPKMFFGKKQVSGQFIMNDNLLGQDVDFFFYNTKDNSTAANYDTTIAILAGTGTYLSNNALIAPSLQAKVVTDPNGSYLNFNISNSSFVQDPNGTQSGGDINIKSDKGFISLNNFYFPKFSDHFGQAGSQKDGYVLKYKWVLDRAIGVWESAFSQSITDISSSGPVTISGNPVIINGFNFSDSNIVATAIGGINAGETFSNVSVMDMIRRIVYTYVPPIVETGFRTSLNGPNVTLVERGDDAYDTNGGNLNLYYKLTVNSTYSISTIGFSDARYALLTPETGGRVQTGQFFPALPISRGTYFNKVKSQISLIPTTFGQSYEFITNTFSVTDTKGTTVSAKAQIISVLPYYYGTQGAKNTSPSQIETILNTTETYQLGKLTPKLVNPIIGTPTASDNQRVILTTDGLLNNQGFLYFGYPSDFPQLLEIRDNQDGNGNDVSSSFSTFSVSIQSPNTSKGWSGDYIFYITTATTSVPSSSVPFKFLFAPEP
jgi:hypothetical protein